MKKQLLTALLLTAGLTNAQITIGTGTAVDSNAGLSTPISNWYATSLSQFIYLASEINGSGNITSLQFKLDEVNALANSNDQISVWVGHTTKSVYTPVISASGADWIPIAGQTQVMTNGSLTLSGMTATFTFTTPFAYNGTDNLVVTVDANEPGNDGSGPLWLQTPSANIMSLMIRTDITANNADPANPPLNYTGGFAAESVQAKTTRPIVTINGLTPLGINQTDIAKVSVFPNPAQSHLYFESVSAIEEIGIYTLTGQKMKTTIQGSSVATDALPTGVYFLKGTFADGHSFATRFVKE
jgi:hypothetical protein